MHNIRGIRGISWRITGFRSFSIDSIADVRIQSVNMIRSRHLQFEDYASNLNATDASAVINLPCASLTVQAVRAKLENFLEKNIFSVK